MKVVVASKNPVKIDAVKLGFHDVFPDENILVSGIGISSGVSHQPIGDKETLEGAINRTLGLTGQEETDYCVGIEGGIEEKSEQMEAFAWIVIKNKSGYISKSRTGTFVIPPDVADLVRQGKELGEADDIVFAKTDSKKGIGAVGILTHNIIDRTSYYRHAVILSLIPFRNPGLYNL